MLGKVMKFVKNTLLTFTDLTCDTLLRYHVFLKTRYFDDNLYWMMYMLDDMLKHYITLLRSVSYEKLMGLFVS